MLEDALGSEDFGTSLDVYEYFINDADGGAVKGDLNEQEYQGIPDSPNRYEERAMNSYDQYIGVEVMLPYRKGKKIMGKIRKCIKHYDIRTGVVQYNYMHEKYLYGVEYHDRKTDQLTDIIMAENMISKV